MDNRNKNRELMENFTEKLLDESIKDSYKELSNDVKSMMKDSYYGVSNSIYDLGVSIKEASSKSPENLKHFEKDMKAVKELQNAFAKLTIGKFL